jgi:hypothetical protein
MSKAERAGDLEIDEDLSFQRREWRVQRGGWVVMAVLILLALLGLTGRGPISQATAGDRDDPFWIEYARIARFEAPAEIRFHARPDAIANGQLEVWVATGFLDRVQIEAISPEPEAVTAAAGRLIYTFAVSDENVDEPLAVTFRFQYETIGRQRGEAGILNGPAQSFNPLVLP